MASIRLDDCTISYQLDGSIHAPVLILSNSLGTSRQMWRDQIEFFSKTHRVLSYDTRGHGRTSVTQGPYSLELLGRDVLALADALEIGTFSFCGISMGGIIGQWLGIYAGHRLDRLVICNTAAKIGQQPAWEGRAALVRSEEGMAPVADGAAQRWFTADYVDDNPSRVAALIDELRSTPVEGYAGCCEALASADLRDAIHGIDNPLLVVAGVHDPVTTCIDADFIADQVAGARRVDLAASHLSNIEAVASFNAAVSEFLG